jgi:bifunctional non-homologous end joining protein LigD
MHARLSGGSVQILTRRGNDWTGKYPPIGKVIAGLPAQNAYLDGELCGVLPDGRTAFNPVQNATDTGQPLVFFLFDLLFLDGDDLTALPLVERKARLSVYRQLRRPGQNIDEKEPQRGDRIRQYRQVEKESFRISRHCRSSVAVALIWERFGSRHCGICLVSNRR